MTAIRRTVLKVALATALLVVAVPAAVLGVTFGGLEPSRDGQALPGGAQLIRTGFANLYMLPAGDGVALIDCGDDAEGRAIKAELTRRGLDGSAVKAIFITHGHRDHIGACRQFPSARVYAFPEERGLVEGREAARGPVPRLRGAAPELGTRVTDPLADGAVVRVGQLEVRAFHIPGHTAGSAAYLAGGVLFLGDSGSVERGNQLRGAAWIFSDDVAESRASVQRLAQRLATEQAQVRALACGHSGPALDATALLRLGQEAAR